MTNFNNRRCEYRVSEKATIFLELQSEDIFNNEPPIILICNSIDFSANGLQLQLDRAVDVGNIFKLCITPNNQGKPIYLVGEVKWVKQAADGHAIGFELFESDQTDIDSWKFFIAEKLTE